MKEVQSGVIACIGKSPRVAGGHPPKKPQTPRAGAWRARGCGTVWGSKAGVSAWWAEASGALAGLTEKRCLEKYCVSYHSLQPRRTDTLQPRRTDTLRPDALKVRATASRGGTAVGQLADVGELGIVGEVAVSPLA